MIDDAYTKRFALTSDEVETHLLVELDLAEVALTVCGEPLELIGLTTSNAQSQQGLAESAGASRISGAWQRTRVVQRCRTPRVGRVRIGPRAQQHGAELRATRPRACPVQRRQGLPGELRRERAVLLHQPRRLRDVRVGHQRG